MAATSKYREIATGKIVSAHQHTDDGDRMGYRGESSISPTPTHMSSASISGVKTTINSTDWVAVYSDGTAKNFTNAAFAAAFKVAG